MRTYLIFAVLYFNSLLAVSQKLGPEKASPFSAVKWEKDQPVVQFENEWYNFEKLGHFSKEELLVFCKDQFGSKWQKRFSEDLVEVLQGLNYQVPEKVGLQLSKQGVLYTYTGIFTVENRNRSVLYNRTLAESNSTTSFHQNISIDEAISDLRQFEGILESISSYSQLSAFDYKLAIKKLAVDITNKNGEVEINRFTNEVRKIMSEIGDRHSSIKNESFLELSRKTYHLRLPFGVAALNGKIIAVKENVRGESYKYYYDSYPYLKSIDGTAVETHVNAFNYKDKKAPEPARLSRGVKALQNYGQLLFENNIDCPDSIAVIFSDGDAEKREKFKLSTARNGYSSKLLQAHENLRDQMSKGSFEGLCKILPQNIGYINIPEMYDYDQAECLEDFIKNAFKGFSKTKALIIDIRNNPGGGRAILQTFASYIVQAKQSPWVANVAYLRTDKALIGNEASMSSRYLYHYNSENLSDNDRKAIDQFKKDLILQRSVDYSKFSMPFYMVLHSGKESYLQPVFILVNEETFSAASIFASAFKSLPNVKIVGETTDGSSGNSKLLYLRNSNISVKVSTMLSFQRNGQTLDGNGTVPDIRIQADNKQVLMGYDSQLSTLINIINDTQ